MNIESPLAVMNVEERRASTSTAVVITTYNHARYLGDAIESVAAHNTGWRASSARYIVFLDADDRLLPNALEANLERFATQPECAFVYGAYRFIDEAGLPTQDAPLRPVGREPYVTLLKGNCIAMHATVM